MTTDRGADARHVPVLLREVLDAVQPQNGGAFLDATFGAGGYTRALLDSPDTRVLALDRDPAAVRDGAALVQAAGGRLT
jgi:16S rRNA (cytosine1402-N4)-methyltransferase